MVHRIPPVVLTGSPWYGIPWPEFDLPEPDLISTTPGCKMVDMSTHRNSAKTLPVEKIKAYAIQRGIATAGMTKNATAARRVLVKLTPAQRRRLAKKGITV